MLLFIFCIFLSFLCFHLATRSYLNPYKLIMIFGKKGSGKTTTLTKIAIKASKKGIPVYSTVEIPGTNLFDVSEIGDKTFPPNSIVLIDEVGMIWDNRDYKNFKPNVRDFFKLQRQYKLTVYLFSQTFDIDKKLRDLTDQMYLLTNVMRVFSVQRRIIKRITISHANENSTGVSSLVDDYKFDSILFGGLKFTFIPRYVCYFKSFNPKKLAYIDGNYLALNEVQSEFLSTRKWLLSCCKVAALKFLSLCRRLVFCFLQKIKGRKGGKLD